MSQAYTNYVSAIRWQPKRTLRYCEGYITLGMYSELAEALEDAAKTVDVKDLSELDKWVSIGKTLAFMLNQQAHFGPIKYPPHIVDRDFILCDHIHTFLGYAGLMEKNKLVYPVAHMLPECFETNGRGKRNLIHQWTDTANFRRFHDGLEPYLRD